MKKISHIKEIIFLIGTEFITMLKGTKYWRELGWCRAENEEFFSDN
jgi:hypothetical protein